MFDGDVILQQLKVQTLETYLPSLGQVRVEIQSSWMWTIMSIIDPGRALSSSFTALCLARAGAVLEDPSLVAQARSQYALALVSLQKALYDPELAFQDRTLAAMRTLSIYEVSRTLESLRRSLTLSNRYCHLHLLHRRRARPTKMAQYNGAVQLDRAAFEQILLCPSFKMCDGQS